MDINLIYLWELSSDPFMQLLRKLSLSWNSLHVVTCDVNAVPLVEPFDGYMYMPVEAHYESRSHCLKNR